jgi:hypothetical protein
MVMADRLSLGRRVLVLGACLGGVTTLALPGPGVPSLSGWQTLMVVWITTMVVLSVPPLDRRLHEARAYVWVLSILGTAISAATALLQVVAGQGPPVAVIGALGAGALASIGTWTRESRRQLSPKATFLADAAQILGSRPGLMACAAVVAAAWVGTPQIFHLKLGRWFGQQPTHQVGEVGPTRIRLVVFTDYQCPECAARHQDYDRVIALAQSQAAGELRTDTYDFPIDSSCNRTVQLSLHPAACEAAVLVRAATSRQQREKIIDELFSHQETMTATSVVETARAFGLLARYQETRPASLRAIEGDVERALMAGVSSTPTYFVNGVRVDRWTPTQLAMILRYLLRQG